MSPSTEPNVVLIMTDQQRADVSAREGFDLDTTPFLDSLAADGVWFDRAYTPIPVCGPARVSCLTGRYPSATRVWENYATDRAVYDRDLFDVTNEAGYATALCGKNHSHLTPDRVDRWFPLSHRSGQGDRSAEERAFDRWMSEELRHGPALEPTPFPLECQMAHRAVSAAEEWIRSLDDEPFFLWLSFPEPHNPFQVPEPYFSTFPPEDLPPVEAGPDALAEKGFEWAWARHVCERRGRQTHPGTPWEELLPRMRSNYFGTLRMIDDQVERFVGFLEAAGLREETLVVFTSDHGDFVGEYGLMRKGPGLPEVLTRVPLAFDGPGVEPRDGPHPAHVSLVDLMPTLSEVVSGSIPRGVQGRSLWPLLAGGEYPEGEFESAYAQHGVGGRYFAPDEPSVETHPGGHPYDELNPVTQSGRTYAVRKGDWKLTFDASGAGHLYDVAADPMETEDLYGRPGYDDVQRELLAEALAWSLRTEDPLPESHYEQNVDERNYWE